MLARGSNGRHRDSARHVRVARCAAYAAHAAAWLRRARWRGDAAPARVGDGSAWARRPKSGEIFWYRGVAATNLDNCSEKSAWR